MMFVISKSPRWLIKMLRNIPIHGSKLDEIYVCLYLTDNKLDWKEFKWFWAPNSIKTRSFRKVNKSHPRLLQSFSLPCIKTGFCKNQSSLKTNMKPLWESKCLGTFMYIYMLVCMSVRMRAGICVLFMFVFEPLVSKDTREPLWFSSWLHTPVI